MSTLIAHVLADPLARQREFGSGTLLHFPVETAVKTGTSTDYRDAWAIGFSHHHTVGVWMGNLAQHPTRGITGSTGPALVLRAIFAELNRHTPSLPLFLSPHLQSATICQLSGQRATRCPPMIEWFLPNTVPTQTCPLHQPASTARVQPPERHALIQLLQPTPGLQLAIDPRLPDGREAFPLRLPKKIKPTRTHWFVDGQQVGITQAADGNFYGCSHVAGTPHRHASGLPAVPNRSPRLELTLWSNDIAADPLPPAICMEPADSEAACIYNGAISPALSLSLDGEPHD